MATDIPRLERPIDVMYVIHHALRAEAARVETLVGQLEEGGSLQPFRQAFYRWVMALAYHADTEDTYMTSLLPDVPAARECELAHSRLAELLEDVQGCLTEEIGRTMVIARTQRHLFGKVVMARIAQDDHLEEEEAFVLPVIRRQLSDAQQLAIVRHLLLDEEAEDPRWHLDWLTDSLTPKERQLLADLAERAKVGPPDWPPKRFTPTTDNTMFCP
jgi:hemerythrin-like domain-containing protein